MNKEELKQRVEKKLKDMDFPEEFFVSGPESFCFAVGIIENIAKDELQKKEV